MLSTLDGALWGLLGGFVVELLQLASDIRAAKGWPWARRRHGPWPRIVASSCRILGGCGLAAAAAAGGQLAGTFGAFGFGVAAPFIIERLVSAIPPTIPIEGSAGSREHPQEPRSVVPDAAS
jgi:hypothetical protein